MKELRLLLNVILLLSMTAIIGSCGKELDVPETPSEETLGAKAQEIFNQLNNTTWTLVSSPYESSPLGNTITFSSIPVIKGAFELHCSYYPNDVFAWMPAPDGGGDLLMTSAITHCNASNGGAFAAQFGSRVYVSISGDIMTLTNVLYSDKRYKYSKTGSNHGNGGDNSGGDEGYEKPEVGFYDYTQYGITSMKVDFIIYNKKEAGVSSAQIKYGTSSAANSSTSTSLVGVHATAIITGLKPNTKYYVKCTVKGKGGSTTSDVVSISL